MKNRAKRYSARVRKEVMEQYQVGAKLKDICEHFGITETTIFYWRRQMGIPKRERNLRTKTVRERAIYLYTIKRMSVKQVARHLKKPSATVRGWIKRAGKMRSVSDGAKILFITGGRDAFRRRRIGIAVKLRKARYSQYGIAEIMNTTQRTVFLWLKSTAAKQSLVKTPKRFKYSQSPDTSAWREFLLVDEIEFVEWLQEQPRKSGFMNRETLKQLEL